MVRNSLFSIEDAEILRIIDSDAAFGRPNPVNACDNKRPFHRADLIPSGLQARGTNIDRQYIQVTMEVHIQSPESSPNMCGQVGNMLNRDVRRWICCNRRCICIMPLPREHCCHPVAPALLDGG